MNERWRHLQRGFCGRLATVGEDGYPYCVPLLYVWMDGEVYLHNARARGHLRANVDHESRVCFEVDEPGDVYAYGWIELNEPGPHGRCRTHCGGGGQMEQTFLGLSPVQIQGCAALLSLLLTASLVVATLLYVRLIKRIAAASEKSLQHVVAIAHWERVAEGAIFYAWTISTKASLVEMAGLDLVSLAVGNSLPERLPGSGPPPELLMRYAQGISGNLLVEVTAALHWIEKGAGCLSEMRVDSPRLGFEELKTKAAEAHGAFEVALQCVNRCSELLAARGTDKEVMSPAKWN